MKYLLLLPLTGCALLDSLNQNPEAIMEIGEQASNAAAMVGGFPAKLIVGGAFALWAGYAALSKGESDGSR